MRFVWLALVISCTSQDATGDHFEITAEETSCGNASRLVRDVCTSLGPTDGCARTGDVCIALCDGLVRCSVVDTSMLRTLNGFAVAPDGYCVICSEP